MIYQLPHSARAAKVHRHRWRPSWWMRLDTLQVHACDRPLERGHSSVIGPWLTICRAIRVVDHRTGATVIVEPVAPLGPGRLRIRRGYAKRLPRPVRRGRR